MLAMHLKRATIESRPTHGASGEEVGGETEDGSHALDQIREIDPL